MNTDTARADLDLVRAALATGVLIRGDLAWSVTAVCDLLERHLEEREQRAELIVEPPTPEEQPS